MNCLALDCSSELLGIAVWRDDQESDSTTSRLPKHPYKTSKNPISRDSLISLSVDAGYRHAERLMSAVAFCLKEAGLDPADLQLLACTGGPGSFTGLRIALSTIKGLALGLSIPFVLVPTLEVWAHHYKDASEWIIPMLDAKRAQVYAAIYRNNRLIDGPFDIKMADLVHKVPVEAAPLLVGPHNKQLESDYSAAVPWRFLPAARQAPLPSLIDLAQARFLTQGPATAGTGLWYLRASDAEEAFPEGNDG